jgi:hypothetical protein
MFIRPVDTHADAQQPADEAVGRGNSGPVDMQRERDVVAPAAPIAPDADARPSRQVAPPSVAPEAIAPQNVASETAEQSDHANAQAVTGHGSSNDTASTSASSTTATNSSAASVHSNSHNQQSQQQSSTTTTSSQRHETTSSSNRGH